MRNGPILHDDFFVQYYKNDKLHREDGPAVITSRFQPIKIQKSKAKEIKIQFLNDLWKKQETPHPMVVLKYFLDGIEYKNKTDFNIALRNYKIMKIKNVELQGS